MPNLSRFAEGLHNPGAEAIGPEGQWGFRHLAPSSASARHREVLLFAASEYERLGAMERDEVVSSRLVEKAKWLRELSGK
jgi:hypothetical protein